jgi:hypothetical protein
MWPFRSNSDHQGLDDVHRKVLELEQRFKVLEREHDDLHASYRRLRGARAVEARDAPKPPPEREQSDSPDAARPSSKDQLRRKYLLRRPGGNGELSHEDS